MLQPFYEKNRNLLVNINGELVHRDQAGVSPFDSSVQNGDAVWEGLRLYNGRIFKLIEHLDRLNDSAKALAYAEIPPHETIIEELRRTLAANEMTDNVHIRLTLTRGVKYTSGMDPRINTAGPTLIVLAEHKPPVYDKTGLRLITSSVRRIPPDCLDQNIHSCNMLNSILAKLQANQAGVDDAVMLDVSRLRGRDQRHPPFHRSRRPCDDVPCPRLPGRHHACHRAGDLPGQRYSVCGDEHLDDRSLSRRRSLLHRHHGRIGDRERDRRSYHRRRWKR